mmetsp:Transcript_23380/g.78955  ORF Transcript_23380/g.78955 Transcript_23380/m.78955 type:complete len:226 (-) Transcript_23380:881-1558(-)
MAPSRRLVGRRPRSKAPRVGARRDAPSLGRRGEGAQDTAARVAVRRRLRQTDAQPRRTKGSALRPPPAPGPVGPVFRKCHDFFKTTDSRERPHDRAFSGVPSCTLGLVYALPSIRKSYDKKPLKNSLTAGPTRSRSYPPSWTTHVGNSSWEMARPIVAKSEISKSKPAPGTATGSQIKASRPRETTSASGWKASILARAAWSAFSYVDAMVALGASGRQSVAPGA